MHIFFLFFDILKFVFRIKGAYALGIKMAFPQVRVIFYKVPPTQRSPFEISHKLETSLLL
jgi:hypothetical protein